MSTALLAVILLPFAVLAMPEIWVPIVIYFCLVFIVAKGLNHIIQKVIDELLE